MTQPPDGADVVTMQTRALHLNDDLPLLYLALCPTTDPHMAEGLPLVCHTYGLPPFNAAAAQRDGHGIIAPAAAGWQIRLTDDGQQVPRLAVDWPAMSEPLVFDVRMTTPPGWTPDVIRLGRAAVMVGPALDWDALTITYAEGDALMPASRLLDALAGRYAACGVMPVVRA
ncbi:hypothetical protein JOL79_06900 [Microbispora sp. RL4-1S]|uniref:Uncharacterized protein n=1 Tax=Microbispora oryzae TaxID=2806554 RepID=A0A941AGZ9_9ACTN|nr:hypothetical protein [Microbispora oryzae]MBP2703526.1 hypothetical protein [Microbispora oryzae]